MLTDQLYEESPKMYGYIRSVVLHSNFDKTHCMTFQAYCAIDSFYGSLPASFQRSTVSACVAPKEAPKETPRPLVHSKSCPNLLSRPLQTTFLMSSESPTTQEHGIGSV